MLQVNETKIPQVYYDRRMEPLQIEPGTARYLPNISGAGLSKVGDVAKLAQNGILTVKRGGGLGDLLFLAPSLQAILKLGVKSILLECAPHNLGLLDGLSGIQTTMRLPSQPAIDLNWSCETAETEGWAQKILRSLVFARLLGVELEDTRPVCAVSDSVRREVKSKYLSGKPLIVMQASAASPDRSLPLPIARSLARALFKETGAEVAVVGWEQPKEFDDGPWLNLNGKLTLKELMGLVANADLVVGLDSGVSYLSIALKRKTVVCMSTIPTSARIDPKWENVSVIRLERGVGCSAPCWGGHQECQGKVSCVASVDTAHLAELVTADRNWP